VSTLLVHCLAGGRRLGLNSGASVRDVPDTVELQTRFIGGCATVRSGCMVRPWAGDVSLLTVICDLTPVWLMGQSVIGLASHSKHKGHTEVLRDHPARWSCRKFFAIEDWMPVSEARSKSQSHVSGRWLNLGTTQVRAWHWDCQHAGRIPTRFRRCQKEVLSANMAHWLSASQCALLDVRYLRNAEVIV
jgi:hypothetical protein